MADKASTVAAASRYIKDGDVLLMRTIPKDPLSEAISVAGRSKWSHAAMARWWGKDLMCVEMLQPEGRAVLLENLVRNYPGRIDVFRYVPRRGKRQAGEVASRLMVHHTATPYGTRSLVTAAMAHLPFVRWLPFFRADLNDSGNGRAMDCSATVSKCYRIAGVDPVANLSDAYTEPGDLARSTTFSYFCTLHPETHREAPAAPAKRKAVASGNNSEGVEVVKKILQLSLTVGMLALLALVFFAIAAHPRPANATEQETMILDFRADWCGPCRSMDPVVKELADQGYPIRQVNVDREQALASQFRVTSIPTFVAVRKSVEVERIVGPTSRSRLVSLFSRNNNPTAARQHVSYSGHFVSVVRICGVTQENGKQSQQYGSGVVIKWGAKTVVMTAYHVVKGAVKILVYAVKIAKWIPVIPLATDATWDLSLLSAEGLEQCAVELAVGDDALPSKAKVLENVGYGTDGILSRSTCSFLRYTGPNRSDLKSADWAAARGRAEQGDSGGPVFNENGKVVGIVWGSDGGEVVFTQTGRLIAFLQGTVPYQKPIVPKSLVFTDATPMRPVPQSGLLFEAGLFCNKPKPQTPPVIVRTDPNLQPTLDRMDSRLVQIQVNTEKDKQDAKKEEDDKPNILIGGCVFLSALIATVAFFLFRK